MSGIIIRPATSVDGETLTALIHTFADHVRLSSECTITPDLIQNALFSPHPAAEAILAEYNGKVEGFAVYFTSFSTFLGKRGLYLEDLYVNPEARGKGVGKAMLMYLVKIASERGYGRVEWEVLDWNTPAIEFYKKLGARPTEESRRYRLNEEAIARLIPE